MYGRLGVRKNVHAIHMEVLFACSTNGHAHTHTRFMIVHVSHLRILDVGNVVSGIGRGSAMHDEGG